MEVCNNPIEIINELMEIETGDHTYWVNEEFHPAKSGYLSSRH